MVEKKSAFERIPKEKANLAYNGTVDPFQENLRKRKRGTKKPSFRRIFKANTISDLFDDVHFYSLLGNGLIFFQNRKTSSSSLIFDKLNYDRLFLYELVNVTKYSNFRILFKIRFINFQVWLFSIFNKNKSLSQAKNKVLIIEAEDVSNIDQLCIAISRIRHMKCGVWFRGFIWYLTPYLVSLFDAMFIFDMSDKEYEILRSAIDITENEISSMRDTDSNNYLADGQSRILFFVNNERVEDAPLFRDNPIIFYL